jgi:hypothetical protein
LNESAAKKAFLAEKLKDVSWNRKHEAKIQGLVLIDRSPTRQKMITAVGAQKGMMDILRMKIYQEKYYA